MRSPWVMRSVLAVLVVALGSVGVFFYLSSHTNVPAPTPIPQTKLAPALVPVHTVIGKTVEGRDIDAYSYGTGPTHVLFVGGMHGGYEWNAVVLAYDFKKYLDGNIASVPDNETVIVIPELNVDGTYTVVGKEGPVTLADIPTSVDTVPGRLNANKVDLNRNFDCHWQPKATWKNKPVSAGTKAFSEPESAALRDFINVEKPVAVVFWHSQSGTVYAAKCDGGTPPAALDLLHAYATAAGYKAQATFDAYPVTGDSEGWLASIGIPALTVELTTHTDVEWQQNLSGIQAILNYFRTK